MNKSRAQNKDKRRFWGLMAVALILMVIAVLTSIRTTEFAEIAFIDVGQGDSACIKTPNGDVVVVDGGEGDSFNDDILPFLLSRGIFSVDYVVASHYHTDHTDGIVDLLSEISVENLIIPETEDESGIKRKLIRLAKEKNVEINEVSAGDNIEISSDLSLEILFPDEELFVNDDKNKNNDSIILKVRCFDTTILFTGDLEKDAETVIAASNADLEADILKVGHHGSYTSTSDEFLEAVEPDYAVLSAGRNNSHGHPHAEVLSRLNNAEVRIFRTDRDGNVIFRAGRNGLRNIEIERNNSLE